MKNSINIMPNCQVYNISQYTDWTYIVLFYSYSSRKADYSGATFAQSHSHINKQIQNPVGYLGLCAFPKGTSTCERTKLEYNLWPSNWKTTTLTIGPQSSQYLSSCSTLWYHRDKPSRLITVNCSNIYKYPCRSVI